MRNYLIFRRVMQLTIKLYFKQKMSGGEPVENYKNI